MATSIIKANTDYVIEQGTKNGWNYRKWKSGICEAWYSSGVINVTPTLWVTPLYYADRTLSIPSGIFTEIQHTDMSMKTSQWWNTGAWATSTTTISYRVIKPGAPATNLAFSVYVLGGWD